MPTKHSLLTAIHKPYAAVYAHAAERTAATGFVRGEGSSTVAFDSTDLYKIVLQLDDASEWVLTAITPTWAQVNGAASLANDSVTNTELANMAQSTIKGRAAGAGTGDPTDLSAAQATAILDAVVGDSGSGGTKGLVPAPGAGDAAANKFLHADGTWGMPTGGSGGLGDVVGPASSIDSEVALFNSTTGKLIKRASGSGIAKLTSGVLSTVTLASTDLSDFNTAVDARAKLLQKWGLNFTANGDIYIHAYEAMTIDASGTAIGTGTLAYEKSTTAAPSTFSSTSLPATLQADAYLKVTVSSISGFKALELKRTA